MASALHLEVSELQLEVGGTPVLERVSFAVRKAEIACLLGPSGCGKTSILRAIAGFLEPSAGEIRLQGKTLSRPGYVLSPEKRRISMVFQDYALFPHMTIRDNIRFGLRKLTPRQRDEKCDFLLSLTQLEPLARRYPHELSGGQQQRAALARSLAVEPDLLLLDEPFSGLDSELRRSLSLRVRELLKNQQTTTIMVTHDQEEAFAMADQVGVMADGALHQWATPYDLYHRPANRFVADFVGRGVFLPGTARDEGVATELGVLRGQLNRKFPAGSDVQVLLRPDDVILDPDAGCETVVSNKHFMGTSTLYMLRLASGNQIESNLPSHEDYPIGARLRVSVDADHLIVFE
jgi:iron(III) transport system ATP-binding protein